MSFTYIKCLVNIKLVGQETWIPIFEFSGPNGSIFDQFKIEM